MLEESLRVVSQYSPEDTQTHFLNFTFSIGLLTGFLLGKELRGMIMGHCLQNNVLLFLLFFFYCFSKVWGTKAV